MKNHNMRTFMICFVIIMLFLAFSARHVKKQNLPQKLYGIPQVITEQVVFEDSRISQILDDGNYMYVMADNHLGYVQVYDLNGVYQYTASFYHTLNGAFSMALDSDALYVRDKESNLYVFQDGQFKLFIEKEDTQEIISALSFKNSSTRYEIRMGSVWRVDTQEPVCVIQRSVIAFIHQYYLDWLFIISLMVLIAFLSMPKHKKILRSD